MLSQDNSWTRAVTAVIVSAFAMEMLLAGPGFWYFGGLPVRRTLTAILTLWMIFLFLSGRAPLRQGHVLLMVSLALFMTIWIVLIPTLRAAQPISDAVQEGLPLALLFGGVFLHAYYRNNPDAWAALRRLCGWTLAAVAVMALAVWVLGTFVVSEPIIVALGFLNFFTLGNESLEPAVYVQTMPDGFFRVMWITSTLMPAGLLYCLASRRPFGAALFAAALFVSYTRALWLATALAIVWAALRYLIAGGRPRITSAWLVVVILATGAVVGADLFSDEGESVSLRAFNRLVATFSDESATDRVDQVGPLIDAWLSSPVFGLGMGGAAAIERSDVVPYLYELTYLALLMKLGVFGSMALIAMLAVVLVGRAQRGASLAHIEACIVAFLLACATNPYLLNLVGLSLLVFLIIDLNLVARSTPASLKKRSRGSGGKLGLMPP